MGIVCGTGISILALPHLVDVHFSLRVFAEVNGSLEVVTPNFNLVVGVLSQSKLYKALRHNNYFSVCTY